MPCQSASAPSMRPMLFRRMTLSRGQRHAHPAAQHQPRTSRFTLLSLPSRCSSKRSTSVCSGKAGSDAATRHQPEVKASPDHRLLLSSDATAAVVTAVAVAALLSHGSPAAAAGLLVRDEPANALSLPTWAIHVSSVIEWVAAMGLVWRYAEVTGAFFANAALSAVIGGTLYAHRRPPPRFSCRG